MNHASPAARITFPGRGIWGQQPPQSNRGTLPTQNDRVVGKEPTSHLTLNFFHFAGFPPRASIAAPNRQTV